MEKGEKVKVEGEEEKRILKGEWEGRKENGKGRKLQGVGRGAAGEGRRRGDGSSVPIKYLSRKTVIDWITNLLFARRWGGRSLFRRLRRHLRGIETRL